MINTSSLLNKYNVPVPRYTSYPTVPFWNESIGVPKWIKTFQSQFALKNKTEGLSLYIHLPFCESLCTYCGCNKKITTNHNVEDEYIDALRKEWELYRYYMNEKPVIRELHLGGGTPTFSSPANLEKMLGAIFEQSIIHPEHEFSIEGHPNNTTPLHLETLTRLGFRRISYGVQDHDPEVQRLINRIQPFENVEAATRAARNAGFKSVNFDLIYGLPGQTLQSMERTIRQTISLRPDRIAFYSYAHVPWKSRGQRLFDENDLPSSEEKLKLYQLGKALFIEAGYADIGMDHFALESDDLYKAHVNGSLHRNFMGYTTQAGGMVLGLGVSAISDTGTAYAQNQKTLHDYYSSINQGQIPVTRGYFMNEEDRHFRQYILDISCRGKTIFRKEDLDALSSYSFPQLELLSKDGLLIWDQKTVQLSKEGMPFLRNICRAFDLHLLRSQQTRSEPLFSKAV
jgi:oxygen-independent coproporphyrinogen-3 oxidase